MTNPNAPVTQEDVAAARYYWGFSEDAPKDWVPAEDKLVQAFARHRLAAIARQTRPVGEDEVERVIFAALDADMGYLTDEQSLSGPYALRRVKETVRAALSSRPAAVADQGGLVERVAAAIKNATEDCFFDYEAAARAAIEALPTYKQGIEDAVKAVEAIPTDWRDGTMPGPLGAYRHAVREAVARIRALAGSQDDA